MIVTLTEKEVRDAVELYLAETFGPVEIREFKYQKRMKGKDPIIVEADITKLKRTVPAVGATGPTARSVTDEDIPF